MDCVDGERSTDSGDDCINIACFDNFGAGNYSRALLQDCDAVAGFAYSRGKVLAVCELRGELLVRAVALHLERARALARRGALLREVLDLQLQSALHALTRALRVCDLAPKLLHLALRGRRLLLVPVRHALALRARLAQQRRV